MKIFSIFALLISVCLFNACCGTTDCDGSDNSASIRLLNKVDSTDLFFGQNPKYDVEQTKFFGLNNGDTVQLFHDNWIYLQDTILIVDFGYDVETAYVQYNDGDMDTFNLFRNTYESHCCGTTFKMEELTFNDTTRMENTYPYIVLLK